MTDTYTPELPPEFRSGNEIPVERATITRERMVEILTEAIKAYQRQQKDRVRQITRDTAPYIEAAAADGKRAADTPHGPVFFSCVGDDQSCPDEPDGWMPIDTAPHDETVLLGWHVDAAWMVEVGMASWGWRNEHVSNISKHGRATHWMPLPPPPEAES